MKRIFLLAILLLYCAVSSRAQSVNEIEDSVSYYLDNIQLKWNSYYDRGDTADSNYFYNQALQKYLQEALAKQPHTIEAKFEKISKKGMMIASSDDNKFRIYSWDEESGGSMHGYYSILQYKTNEKVKADIIYPKEGTSRDFAEDKDAPGYFYPRVYSVTNKNGNTYYLAVRNGTYSNSDASTGIKAYTIEKSLVNDSIEIFKTVKENLNSIDYEYDYFSNYNDKTDRGNYEIHLSNDKQKLFIPVVKANKVTNKFLVYKFNGYNYVFDRNAK